MNTGAKYIPPGPPWKKIRQDSSACGYLVFYYSDDLSPLPVRSVTKLDDNKADPNLETLTYGLFSPCGQIMRKGIVRNGTRYLFFVTRYGGVRVLVGYYSLRWYAKIAGTENDYALAATTMRFIAEPMPLDSVDRKCGTMTNRQFRIYLKVESADVLKLKSLVDGMLDTTQKYLEEIDRLERFNVRYTGYRYVSFAEREKFSWGNPRVKRIIAPNRDSK